MDNYATVNDIIALFRPLSTEEIPRAEELIEVVSATLRHEARLAGRDLEQMLSEDADLVIVARSVVVDVVSRVLMTSTNQEPMTQFSQSAGGYSVSGSFLVPGGGIFIKKSELARLGIRRQRVGMVELFPIGGDA